MTSPEVQRYAIEAYAARQGIEIMSWVEGIDESGSRSKSAWWAKLDGAVEQMERSEVDVIVVWKFSRTARHRLRWAVALDRVDAAGGSLESATEQTDATPAGRFQRGMLGEMNAYQAELIGETWKEAHARRLRAGLPATGGPRFGYVLTEEGRYEPDPVVGAALAEAYSAHLRGQGFSGISQALNRDGFTAHHGRPWARVSLAWMLDSGFAAGLLVTNSKGENKNRPLSERTWLPGAHEPLISMEVWEAYLSHRLAGKHGRWRPTAEYVLSGLVFCTICGGRMSGGPAGGKHAYVCGRGREGISCSKRLTIRQSVLEPIAERWLFSLSEDVDARIEAMESTRTKVVRSIDDLAATQRKLARVHERMGKLTLRNIDGDIPDAAYQAAVAALDRERQSLEERARRAVPNPTHEQSIRELAHNLRSLWPDASPEERRVTYRQNIGRIDISPTTHGPGGPERRVKITPRWELADADS